MSLSDHRHAVRAFLDAIVAGDIRDEQVTDDFHAWTTVSGPMPGERYRGGVRLLAKVFTRPLQMNISSLTAEEDRVVVELQSHGPLISGEEYRNSYVFIFRLRDGRVASVTEHFNPAVVGEKLAPLMRQLMGAITTSPED